MLQSKAKILFQLTGSIACYKACFLISKLVQSNYDVQVVATESALKFVGEATLEGLTGKPVYSELWQAGKMMDHIKLNRWADLAIVAPATANFINSTAHGLGNDLLTTLFLAHDFSKPYLIVPAMNTAMYKHPSTQDSLLRLKSMGLQVLETREGVLACGETGYGRLLEPDLIFQEIEIALKKQEQIASNINKGHVLITSGGTTEPIDEVRVITNKSTGATGAAIANSLIQLGYHVTYLHAKSAQLPFLDCIKVEFETFTDLQNQLRSLLAKDYSAIVHAAAVGDFSIEKAAGKISSTTDLQLTLKKNKKLIESVREWSSNKNIKLIAFKMTSDKSPIAHTEAVENIFKASNADLVIHNDTNEFSWQLSNHKFHLHLPNHGLKKSVIGKQQLALEIGNFMEAQTCY